MLWRNAKQTLKNYFVVRQPVVQQMKVLFAEVKEEFHTQDAKIDAKIEALINLQKERLEFEKEMQKQRMALEREKLNFERQKAGFGALPSASGDLILIHFLYDST